MAALWQIWSLSPSHETLSADDAAEVHRLEGHTVRIAHGSYEILDVAGEGAPLIGCVERVNDALVLVTDTERMPLLGPLAVPRIAGPRYKVWVVGDRDSNGALAARRLGILAGPERCRPRNDRPSQEQPAQPGTTGPARNNRPKARA